ncbi:uncharacterized protein BP01DRAFT_262815, partial [Aspergillus saccharolyticus JOP 1030-1]
IYRQLFSLVFLSNLAIFIWIVVRDRSVVRGADAAAANFLACGLARQPLIVNGFFITLCSIPRSLPLRLRRMAANVYQYGGVHSGCGMASLLWYLGMLGGLTREFCTATTHATPSIIALVLAYLIVVLLLAIIAVAYPAFRVRHHNTFELTHRYGTWAVVALFLVLLLVFAQASSPNHIGEYLCQRPAFWCVCLAAGALIHPWTRLRQIPVQCELLSSHALRLHLPGGTHLGKVITLAQHPLRDWHSFATFSDASQFPDPSAGSPPPSCSIIVSRAGDWTSELLVHPPTTLYTRGVQTYGFTRTMRLFHRIVLVATGSGIGPCLAFLEARQRPAIKLCWQTRAPEKTYGKEIWELVHQLDPHPLVVDTDVAGRRVDLVPVVEKLYGWMQAEMVCVVSNQRETERMVKALRARGVYALGPVFDS